MTRLLGRLVLAMLVVGGLLSLATGIVLARQPTPEQITDEIVARINEERAALGLEPLLINDQLAQMARWRSEDMVDGNYFSHDPPKGHPTLGNLCERLDYDPMFKPIENIVTMRLALGRYSADVAERAVNSWSDSPDHWRWAVSSYTDMTGVGVAVGDGYVVITQLFWSGGLFTPEAAYQHNQRPSPAE